MVHPNTMISSWYSFDGWHSVSATNKKKIDDCSQNSEACVEILLERTYTEFAGLVPRSVDEHRRGHTTRTKNLIKISFFLLRLS